MQSQSTFPVGLPLHFVDLADSPNPKITLELLFDQPRSQGLFSGMCAFSHPGPKPERALRTRLLLDSNLTFDSVIRPLKSCSLLDHEILSNENGDA